MPRKLPEWSSKNHDTAPPPRVRLRIYEAATGRCQGCTRKVIPGKWQADHIVALINGGENRETNLQLICDECHKAKTGDDVAEKAAVTRKRAKHVGVKNASKWRGFQTNRGGKWKSKIGGGAVRREK